MINRPDEEGVDLLPTLGGKTLAHDQTLFWRRQKGLMRKQVEEDLAIQQDGWR